MPERPRAADVTVLIDASIEDTWQALTEARELERWFPLRAEVRPGVGGSMAWRWEDDFSMVAGIDAWEPPGRLRLVQEREAPHAADGSVLDVRSRARIVMEFTLETHEGRTRLRLVHSGFGSDAAWDDELEGVTHGWNFELRQLAHYLGGHRGRDRHVGWAHTTVGQSHAGVWRALTGADGFALPEPMRPAGSPFTLGMPGGSRLSGTSRLYAPERDWFGTVRELDDGLVRVWSWPGGGRTGVAVWFSTWNDEHVLRVKELGQMARRVLDRTFGRTSDTATWRES
jgi:uncharacterized protein YndB with AHSA1/START domain